MFQLMLSMALIALSPVLALSPWLASAKGRQSLWTAYGFRDAFNLTSNPDWYGADVLGIDQGPIIIMIENYRTGNVWRRFMRNPEILHGLRSGRT